MTHFLISCHELHCWYFIWNKVTLGTPQDLAVNLSYYHCIIVNCMCYFIMICYFPFLCEKKFVLRQNALLSHADISMLACLQWQCWWFAGFIDVLILYLCDSLLPLTVIWTECVHQARGADFWLQNITIQFNNIWSDVSVRARKLAWHFWVSYKWLKNQFWNVMKINLK